MGFPLVQRVPEDGNPKTLPAMGSIVNMTFVIKLWVDFIDSVKSEKIKVKEILRFDVHEA